MMIAARSFFATSVARSSLLTRAMSTVVVDTCEPVEKLRSILEEYRREK